MPEKEGATVENGVSDVREAAAAAFSAKMAEESVDLEAGQEDKFVPVEPEEKAEEKGPPPEEKAQAKEAPSEKEVKEPEPTREEPEEYDTLRVDGREEKRTKREIYEAGRRALQKDLAADKRLEEATRLLREAAEERKRLLEPAQKAPDPIPPSELQKKIRESRRKQLEATNQEELDALVQEEETFREQWYDARQREKAEMERQQAQEQELRTLQAQAAEAVAEKFPDWQDTNADREFQTWLNTKPMYRYHWDNVPEAAGAIQILSEWAGLRAQSRGFEQTRARKAGIDTVQAASGRVPKPEEEKIETSSDYVRRLKKERGHAGADL